MVMGYHPERRDYPQIFLWAKRDVQIHAPATGISVLSPHLTL
jgi:hypothetical protein